MNLEKTHKFDETFLVGVDFEYFILEKINKKYPLAHRFVGDEKKDNSYYDIIIPELSKDEDVFGIECKNDVKGLETQNIFIEIAQDGKESGIEITKSKMWVQGDGEYVYVAYVDEIKNRIRTEYLDELKKVEEDNDYVLNLRGIRYNENYPIKQDGYYKYMNFYLVPKNLFKEWCVTVTNYSDFELSI